MLPSSRARVSSAKQADFAKTGLQHGWGSTQPQETAPSSSWVVLKISVPNAGHKRKGEKTLPQNHRHWSKRLLFQMDVVERRA